MASLAWECKELAMTLNKSPNSPFLFSSGPASDERSLRLRQAGFQERYAQVVW